MADCPIGMLLDLAQSPAHKRLRRKSRRQIVEGDKSDVQIDGATQIQTGEANAGLPVEIDRSTSQANGLTQSVSSISIEDVQEDSSKPNSASHNTSLEDDIKLLDQEEFDFDIQLSPSSCKDEEKKLEVDLDEEDDDEIFFGPVGFTETCVAKNVEEVENDVVKPLSPLSAEMMVLLFKEAQTVACRISAATREMGSAGSSGSISDHSSLTDSLSSQPSLGVSAQGLVSPPRENAKSLIPDNNLCQGEAPMKTLPSMAAAKDKNGLKRYSGPSKLQSSTSSKASTAGSRPTSLVKPSNLKAPGPLQRSGSFRLKQPAAYGAAPKVRSPQKRRRLSSRDSVNDETSSVCSDTSDVSTCSLPVSGTHGKRPPPQSKLKMGLPLSQLSASSRIRTLSSTGRVISSPGKSSMKRSSIGHTSTTGSNVSGLGQPKAKPVIKGAMTKLDLLKPGALQRKTLKATGTKLVKPEASSSSVGGPMKTSGLVKSVSGPLRAMAPLKSLQPTSARSPAPMAPAPNLPKSRHSIGTPTKTTPVKKPELRRSIASMSTPVKQEKSVQPKRLLSDASTPKKESNNTLTTTTTPKSVKRRSFLPTPGKSSSEQVRGRSPSVGARRALVQHTPVNKENLELPKRSIWSPVRRTKPIGDGDEYFQCTKRIGNF